MCHSDRNTFNYLDLNTGPYPRKILWKCIHIEQWSKHYSEKPLTTVPDLPSLTLCSHSYALTLRCANRKPLPTGTRKSWAIFQKLELSTIKDASSVLSYTSLHAALVPPLQLSGLFVVSSQNQIFRAHQAGSSNTTSAKSSVSAPGLGDENTVWFCVLRIGWSACTLGVRGRAQQNVTTTAVSLPKLPFHGSYTAASDCIYTSPNPTLPPL